MGLRAFGNRLPVDRRRHGHGHVLAHQMVERPHPLFRSHPPRARGFELYGDSLPLLLGFTQSRPRPPGDRLAGQTQRTAMGGKLVQEHIGRGVVRLP